MFNLCVSFHQLGSDAVKNFFTFPSNLPSPLMPLLVRIPMSPTSKLPGGSNNPKKSGWLPLSRGERIPESEQGTHIVISDTAIWYHYWRAVLHAPRMCGHCCSTPVLDQVPASLIPCLDSKVRAFLVCAHMLSHSPLKHCILGSVLSMSPGWFPPVL